ncbi:MAG: hypothetical protein CM1200mP18_23640 [Gammaproteobacteria bacterium]|nr:MAG: hypothetical protein CM1200mP18_23640 [Gammaproteobacteria bacterium]
MQSGVSPVAFFHPGRPEVLDQKMRLVWKPRHFVIENQSSGSVDPLDCLHRIITQMVARRLRRLRSRLTPRHCTQPVPKVSELAHCQQAVDRVPTCNQSSRRPVKIPVDKWVDNVSPDRTVKPASTDSSPDQHGPNLPHGKGAQTQLADMPGQTDAMLPTRHRLLGNGRLDPVTRRVTQLRGRPCSSNRTTA